MTNLVIQVLYAYNPTMERVSDPAPTYASKIVIQSIHTHISRRDEVICMTRAYFV